MRKVVKLAEAVGRMPDGVVLMIGGFMGASTPPWLVQRSGPPHSVSDTGQSSTNTYTDGCQQAQGLKITSFRG